MSQIWIFQTWVNFQACSPVEADSGKMPKTSFSAAFPPRSDHLNTTLHLNSVLLTPSLPNILRNTSTKQKPAISAAFNMSNLNLACTKSEKLDAHDAKIIWLCLFEESGGAAQWEALQACSTAHSSQLTAPPFPLLLQARTHPRHATAQILSWWIGHGPKVRWGWKSLLGVGVSCLSAENMQHQQRPLAFGCSCAAAHRPS